MNLCLLRRNVGAIFFLTHRKIPWRLLKVPVSILLDSSWWHVTWKDPWVWTFKQAFTQDLSQPPLFHSITITLWLKLKAKVPSHSPLHSSPSPNLRSWTDLRVVRGPHSMFLYLLSLNFTSRLPLSNASVNLYVCICDCVYAVCVHRWKPEEKLGTLLCHSPPYFQETGSPTEPGESLAASKPHQPSCPHPTHCFSYRHTCLLDAGIETQVLVFGQQALLATEPSPCLASAPL